MRDSDTTLDTQSVSPASVTLAYKYNILDTIVTLLHQYCNSRVNGRLLQVISYCSAWSFSKFILL